MNKQSDVNIFMVNELFYAEREGFEPSVPF